MNFSKMSGNGNDFILIDNRQGEAKGLVDENFVKKVCHRGLSVGADGLILIEKSAEVDFAWKFYNSDGSEADMCGNGARCAARFAYIKRIAPKEMRFKTGAGVIEGYIKEGVNVKVLLTKPHSFENDITIDGMKLSYINTGVPHVVIEVDDIKRVDVAQLGAKIRYHKHFAPSGTNVNFINKLSDSSVAVRTYERGVEAETLACGTGSVASAIVAFKNGVVSSSIVDVLTASGKVLKVYVESDDKVYLEGEARFIYDGSLNLEAYRY